MSGLLLFKLNRLTDSASSFKVYVHILILILLAVV